MENKTSILLPTFYLVVRLKHIRTAVTEADRKKSSDKGEVFCESRKQS
jgi:hypothetical protein